VAIDVHCVKCDRKFRVPDPFAGKRIKCPKCQGAIDVPTAQEPAETPSAAEVAVAVSPAPAAIAETPATVAAPRRQPAAASQWRLRIEDGQEFGPISKEELDSWLEDERIDLACHIYCDTWGDWKPAVEVYPQLAPNGQPDTATGTATVEATAAEPVAPLAEEESAAPEAAVAVEAADAAPVVVEAAEAVAVAAEAAADSPQATETGPPVSAEAAPAPPAEGDGFPDLSGLADDRPAAAVDHEGFLDFTGMGTATSLVATEAPHEAAEGPHDDALADLHATVQAARKSERPADAPTDEAAMASIRETFKQTRRWIKLTTVLGFLVGGVATLIGLYVIVLAVVNGKMNWSLLGLGLITGPGLLAVAAYALMGVDKKIRALVNTGKTGELEAVVRAQQSFWKLASVLLGVAMGMCLVLLAIEMLVRTLGIGRS
jgi:hypothetical protein